MKKIILTITLVFALIGIFSCQDNNMLDTPSESSLLSSTLSKDSDFNKLIEGINNLQKQIYVKASSSSSSQREEDFGRLTSLLKKGDNLNSEELIEVSKLLGYSDINTYKSFLDEQKYLGERLTEKFTSLKQKSDKERLELFKTSIQESTFMKKNNASLKEGGGDGITEETGPCDRKMLAACVAGAYGAYVVVVTSNCPGAAIFGPYGVGLCLAGASITYAAALYTCGDAYGCR